MAFRTINTSGEHCFDFKKARRPISVNVIWWIRSSTISMKVNFSEISTRPKNSLRIIHGEFLELLYSGTACQRPSSFKKLLLGVSRVLIWVRTKISNFFDGPPNWSKFSSVREGSTTTWQICPNVDVLNPLEWILSGSKQSSPVVKATMDVF